MKHLKFILTLCGFTIGAAIFAQTPNNCNEYTSVGTTSSPYGAGSNVACNALVPGVVTGTGAWTGSGCTGFITSTVTGPPVTCLTLSYAYVNFNDYATITTDTGGILTITGINVGVAGNVVGPYTCPQTFPYGNVSITVCSTIPFNSVTLTNTGCTSGWVINCVQQTTNPCDASWTTTTACSTDPPIDLDLLITGDTGGTWSGTGVTGNMFDPSSGSQSITYSSPNGCDSIQTITVTTTADASWTPPTGLCLAAGPIDLNTTITGTAGGTWSGTGVTGSMFDPSVGSQTITYTVGTAPCDDVSAQLINVAATADASWTIPTGLCIGDAPIDLNPFITGNAGGTWTGTGMTGSMFDPSVGSQNITYSVGTVPCDATSAQMITVAPLANPAWTPPANICDYDPPFDLTTIVTGDPGGTWSGTGVTGNNFDPSVGTQTLTYTVGTGGCQAVSAQSFNVNPAPDPSWTTLSMCASGAPVNLDAQVTGLAGGTWSGTGMSGSVFDPFFGTQNITYSVSAGGCTAISTQAVTVLDPQLTMSATNVSCFGLTDGTATVTVTGGSGGQNYLWNPSGQSTQTANNLGAGSYQVTVTDGTCIVVDSVTILAPVEITAVLTRINGCDPAKGSAAVLANGGVGGFTYAWSPSGQTTANPTQLDSAMHTVIVTDANGCTHTDSILVQVLPAPAIVAMNDTTIIYPNCINLTATGGVSYEWTTTEELDCYSCLSPEACPILSNQYCVEGTDANGCKNTDCVIIDVEIICGEVFVPSAFSPNNDGENDLECMYSDCIESMTFTIYNRWGEKVFETNDMNICWDGTWKGKPLNSAVFVYVLDGYLINGQTIEQKGNISLIR